MIFLKLLNLDTKNRDLEQLGLDAIKEQHRINLQFSSDKCAIIQGDHAQVMLAAVSIFSLHSNAVTDKQLICSHSNAF